MDWYLGAFRKCFEFSGRAGRTEFWYFFLFNMIVSVMLVVIDASMSGVNQKITFAMLSLIYVAVAFLSGLCVSIRRLHDIGRSGWWVLIGLIPLLGLIVLLAFCVLDGNPDDNVYGKSLKQNKIQSKNSHLIPVYNERR